MVRVLGGGELASRAVTLDELTRARAALHKGALPGSARARVQALLMALLDADQVRTAGGHLLSVIDAWLAQLTETLGALDPDDIDPRFVEGVLVTTRGARA